MQPIQDLLHRIKWDPEFGKGVFALGYDDRVADKETRVAVASIRFDPRRPSTFSCEDENGTVVHIPLHRVRTVYKDGVVIWQRRLPVRRGGPAGRSGNPASRSARSPSTGENAETPSAYAARVGLRQHRPRRQ